MNFFAIVVVLLIVDHIFGEFLVAWNDYLTNTVGVVCSALGVLNTIPMNFFVMHRGSISG